MLRPARSSSRGGAGGSGSDADDVGRAEAPVGVEPDRVDRRRRLVLVRERRRDAEDPRGVRGRGVGAERVREATVRALDLVARRAAR